MSGLVNAFVDFGHIIVLCTTAAEKLAVPVWECAKGGEGVRVLPNFLCQIKTENVQTNDWNGVNYMNR